MEPRDALLKAAIFSDLGPDSIDPLARAATVREFRAGEILEKEGENAVALHVMVSGEAEVVKGLGGDERVLGKLSAGDFFGEMALLDGFPRSASVRATTDCEVIALTRWDFLGVLRSDIEVALAMLPVLSRRLRECEDMLLP